jgi:LPXTG-motif cell wall-anchored protein
MDFIERLLGFAPDNGDNSVLILWLIVLALLVATIAYFRLKRRRQQP